MIEIDILKARNQDPYPQIADHDLYSFSKRMDHAVQLQSNPAPSRTAISSNTLCEE